MDWRLAVSPSAKVALALLFAVCPVVASAQVSCDDRALVRTVALQIVGVDARPATIAVQVLEPIKYPTEAHLVGNTWALALPQPVTAAELSVLPVLSGHYLTLTHRSTEMAAGQTDDGIPCVARLRFVSRWAMTVRADPDTTLVHLDFVDGDRTVRRTPLTIALDTLNWYQHVRATVFDLSREASYVYNLNRKSFDKSRSARPVVRHDASTIKRNICLETHRCVNLFEMAVDFVRLPRHVTFERIVP
jgi:hypothetical protein